MLLTRQTTKDIKDHMMKDQISRLRTIKSRAIGILQNKRKKCLSDYSVNKKFADIQHTRTTKTTSVASFHFVTKLLLS